MTLKPMHANPGGEIAPDDAVGRDKLVAHLWKVLARQSVVMVSERRMGKTTVVKKMRTAPPKDHRLIYSDVEGVGTPLEFAERVVKDVDTCLSGASKARKKLRTIVTGDLAGFEIAGVVKFPPKMQEHWKQILERTIELLLRHEPKLTFVFAWDELPLMLQKIARSSDAQTSMDVLDMLRGLRQAHSHLRMLFTGSVGLHHAVSAMKNRGASSTPTNDMLTLEVTELSPQDGCALARALIDGEELCCSDPEASANAISAAADHIPFYIHHLVSQLKDRGATVDPERIDVVVDEALRSAQDVWHLRHYRERLDTYYSADAQPLVLSLLDALAIASEPLSFAILANHLHSTMPREAHPAGVLDAILGGDDEPLREHLDLLQRDHYIKKEQDGGFRFRFPLIERWWRLQRSIR